MDNAGYVTLTRQSGLMRELQVLAHNMANSGTTGFRREGVVFAEHVKRLDGAGASLSMALGHPRLIDLRQGALEQTGGTFDIAIEGEGFFVLDTPRGERLARGGVFLPNAAGELVNPDGHRVLDDGGAPIFIPPDARDIAIARDGTMSADGNPVAQIALVMPADPLDLQREAGGLFATGGGLVPVAEPAMLQRFVEGSNVDPMTEIARLIAVQRAYEQGQRFLEREDERQRNVIQTLGR